MSSRGFKWHWANIDSTADPSHYIGILYRARLTDDPSHYQMAMEFIALHTQANVFWRWGAVMARLRGRSRATSPQYRN